jgi:hypothetical protein
MITERSSQLEPVQPWREAILALPFACLCALGWTPWLPVWVLLFAALVPFAARRFAGSAQYAPWASVYAAALALFAGGDWLSRLGMFFAALALSYLIGVALDGVRDGTPWAWIAPLIVFAVWPNPWSALGALGLALLGALENRRLRSQSELGHVRLEGIAALGLVAVALAVLGLTLGRPSGFDLDRVSNPPARTQTREEPKAANSGPSGTVFARPDTPPIKIQDPQSMPVNLSLQIALLVLLLVIGLSILRMQLEKRRGAQNGWNDLIPVVGMVVLVLAVLAWSLLARGSGGDAPGSRPGGDVSGGDTVQDARIHKNTVQNTENPPTDPTWPMVVTLVVAIAAGAYFLYLVRRAPEPPQDDLEVKPALAAPPDRVQATNRVREAYRTFLRLCLEAGIPKVDSETPLEFAARVTERHPDALGSSSRLTALYEPVRYGKLADFSGALEAETAVRDLHGILGHEPSGFR